MKMTRQQRRKVHKLTGQEIRELEIKATRIGIQQGVQLTLNAVYKVMNEEFGFGDKRLDRLEEGILKKIEEMGE